MSLQIYCVLCADIHVRSILGLLDHECAGRWCAWCQRVMRCCPGDWPDCHRAVHCYRCGRPFVPVE